MYNVGDKVKYNTIHVRYLNGSEKIPQEKVGVIEEVTKTVDNKTCYWIEGEKLLIQHSQIKGLG